MAHSTRARAGRKQDAPKLPKGFPLTLRKSDGRFCKKVRGTIHYFTGTPDEALTEWLRVKDHLLSDRPAPPKNVEGLTIKGLGNRFLEAKQDQLDSGDLAPRTFARYKASIDSLIAEFGVNQLVEGLTTDDFRRLRRRMAKRFGAISLANEIQMVKTALKFAYEEGLIVSPIRFGQAFDKPSQRRVREALDAKGPRLFTPEQLTDILAVAKPAMRAMVLLGVQAGLGNTDLALLTIKRATAGEWLDYPRSKTGVPRRIPLWKETREAIDAVLANRKEPTDPADGELLFIGTRGESYVGGHKGYRVTQEFADTCKRAKVTGRAFYDLRRTFQTVAEGAHDLTAVQAIMGHAHNSTDMSARYRQGIDDARLLAVVAHVHGWLYGKAVAK